MAHSDGFVTDGIRFWHVEKGAGLPFVLQHGLGGDRRQPLQLYAYRPDVRFVAMDCRGHGKTQPLGDPDRLSFATFADDVVALADHLGLPAFVVGGISMGAGVALNLALRYPQRVRGLVLIRPAWLAQTNPPNLDDMAAVGRLIGEKGVPEGKAAFLRSARYAAVRQASPYTADTLLAQFDEPRAADAWERLVRLPADAPTRDAGAWAGITVPTLVIATPEDPVHPAAYAQTLAAAIPRARLVEVPSKAVDAAAYVRAVRKALDSYLQAQVALGRG